mgnify:CR=1 FL=1
MKEILGTIILWIMSHFILLAQQDRQLLIPKYPASFQSTSMDTLHGNIIPDPYRWLENSTSEQAQEWLQAQDKLTRSQLEALPLRKRILEQMEVVRALPIHYDAPHPRKGYWYYQKSWRDSSGVLQQGLFRRFGHGGQEELLVDVGQFGPEASFATYAGSGAASFQLSQSGRYLAFGVHTGNSTWSTWRVFDVRERLLLADQVEGIHIRATQSTVCWLPDESGFYYTAFPELDKERPLGQQVYFHEIGRIGQDPIVYANEAESPLQFSVGTSSKGRYLVIRTFENVQNGLMIKDLKEPTSAPKVVYSGVEQSLRYLRNQGKDFYFSTDIAASKGKIVHLRLDGPSLEEAKTLIPEQKNATLIGAYVIGDRYLIQYVEDALPAVETYDFKGRLLGRLDLPYIGWLPAGFVGIEGESHFAFNIQNTADPGSTYLMDITTGQAQLFFKRSDNFEARDYITKQVFYPAKDGTKIPLFIMFKKGLDLSKKHPLWLYAYGSRWSAAPWYQIQHRVWLDLGGVYALANIRGGGEYGQEWIEAGLGVNKQTGIDDYIAAGEWLIDQGYTDNQRLVANGGSASAPLAGAALNQRPDLFGAGSINYGNTDLIRYNTFAGSMGNIHGDPADPEMFQALLKWSPYHNVQENACYPPVLITHGNQDRLLASWNSYKLAAKLQAAQACSNPIFLQIAWDRGHTVGGLEERVNQLTFLLNAIGWEEGSQ